jgi:hypothetical protein
MSAQATAKFQMKGWEETPYSEFEGSKKLVRSAMNGSYEGDVEGDSTTEMLLAYSTDDFATYVGLERIEGSVEGRAGSFVLQHAGRFADGVAKSTSTIVVGAGTGELSGLTGSGTFEAPMGETAVVTLEYDLD